MNCAEARHIILTADPVALRDPSDPGLREHMATCQGCAADAGRVLDDIGRLRAALIARGSRAASPRRSRRRAAVTLIPLALAAELALFAFLSNRDSAMPLRDRTIIDDTVTTLLPVAHTETDTGEVLTAAVKEGEPPVIATIAMAEDTTENPDSLGLAVPPSFTHPALQLQVMPQNPGEHVAVIATSNPKITLVWITKGDSL